MDSEKLLERKVVLTVADCVAEAITLDQKLILLDSRSYMVYHTSHIHGALNIGGNRAFQRKLSRNQVPIDLLLRKLTNMADFDELKRIPIIVYDNCLDSLSNLRPDCFLYDVLLQLTSKFSTVFLLRGGFLSFQAQYPDLCWNNTARIFGEDVAEYNQANCELEQLLDFCLTHISSSTSETGSELKVHGECGSPSTPSTSDNSSVPLTLSDLDSSSSKNFGSLDFSSSDSSVAQIHETFSSTDSTSVQKSLIDVKRFITARPNEATETKTNESVKIIAEDKAAESIISSNRNEMKSGSALHQSLDSFRPSPILPHLVLGSQEDAASHTVCKQYGITHIVNVSVEGPIPTHIPSENVHRIPVNDNYTDRITPYFRNAFAFIDSAKLSRGRVLIHCSAGISRSPTLAIAYLMYSCRMKMREAYDVVKSGRASVAPNFNFLGQLLEFEHYLLGSEVNKELFDNLPQVLISEVCSFPTTSEECLSSEKVISPSCSNVQIIKNVRLQNLPITKPSTRHSSRPITLTPCSPKQLSKKRDRPTYLGIDPVSSYASKDVCEKLSPSVVHPSLTDPDLSPAEGKRSRVSTFAPLAVTPTALLPSPCTGLSRLEISSPLEEYRCLLSVTRAPTTGATLFPPRSDTINHRQKIQSFLTTSSTSLNTLRFEPCSVVHHSGMSSRTSSSYKLRRSLSTLTNVTSTLLAHHSLSSHASAPPTPRQMSVERSQTNVPNKTGTITSLYFPPNTNSAETIRARELSPSVRISREPKLEYDYLQKSGLISHSVQPCESTNICSHSTSPFHLSENTLFLPDNHEISDSGDCLPSISQLSATECKVHSTSVSKFIKSTTTDNISQFSRSVPSRSRFEQYSNCEYNIIPNSNPPFPVIRNSQSLDSELVLSTNVNESDEINDTFKETMNAMIAIRFWQPLSSQQNSKTICRHQQSCIQSSSSNSSLSSSSTNHSTHSNSCYGLYSVF